MSRKKAFATEAERDEYKRQLDIKERNRLSFIADSQSKLNRDIGKIPAVVNRERRQACQFDFLLFCRTYLAQMFKLDFSEDHLSVIRSMQATVLGGGQIVYAMPRGQGKTTLAEAAAIWSVLYGHHKYSVVVAATAPKAANILTSIKTSLESNLLLREDFPEICVPIAKLEGESRKVTGQLCNGERTRMHYSDHRIILPTIFKSACLDYDVTEDDVLDNPYTPCSGALLDVVGLSGAIRGLFYTTAAGERIRPSLVLCDDPQTDESAKSETQAQDRYKLIVNLRGLEGPDGTPITLIIPCTKVLPGDTVCMLMEDIAFRRFLFPICDGLPEAMKLWMEYWTIRSEEIEKDIKGIDCESNKFYAARQAEMDLGCNPRWPSRHKDNELSATQYCMNIYLSNQELFYNEYMNDPRGFGEAEDLITEPILRTRLNGLQRRAAGARVDRLTMFIDCHSTVLVWGLCGWTPDFTGYLLDYGYWPDDPGVMPVVLAHARRKISDEKGSFESALHNALTGLMAYVSGLEIIREDGIPVPLRRVLVDANWGPYTDLVYDWVKFANRKYDQKVMPSHGQGIGPSSQLWAMKEINKQKQKEGSRWNIKKGTGRSIEHITFDTNYWKTYLAARLNVGIGGVGSFSIFGDSISRHSVLVSQLTAEECERTIVKEQKVDNWKLKRGRAENHLFDVLVGNCVAASETGCILPNAGHKPTKVRKEAPAIPQHLYR